MISELRAWSGRQWMIAGLAAVVVAVVMGMATAVIDNPVFVRMIPTPWWAYPVWLASAVLSGLLAGTYVAPAGRAVGPSDQRRGVAGVLLAWFAVGCPTCNVLVVLALGTGGAVTWFQPVQPILAVGSLALLGVAVRSRLRGADGCAVPRPPRGR